VINFITKKIDNIAVGEFYDINKSVFISDNEKFNFKKNIKNIRLQKIADANEPGDYIAVELFEVFDNGEIVSRGVIKHDDLQFSCKQINILLGNYDMQTLVERDAFQKRRELTARKFPYDYNSEDATKFYMKYMKKFVNTTFERYFRHHQPNLYPSRKLYDLEIEMYNEKHGYGMATSIFEILKEETDYIISVEKYNEEFRESCERFNNNF